MHVPRERTPNTRCRLRGCAKDSLKPASNRLLSKRKTKEPPSRPSPGLFAKIRPMRMAEQGEPRRRRRRRRRVTSDDCCVMYRILSTSPPKMLNNASQGSRKTDMSWRMHQRIVIGLNWQLRLHGISAGFAVPSQLVGTIETSRRDKGLRRQ